MHEERKTKTRNNDKVPDGAVPAYLLDREGQSRAKILSNMVKQKRKEKAVSPGFCPKNEVAGDKFIVGRNRALAHLGKAVTVLFTC